MQKQHRVFFCLFVLVNLSPVSHSYDADNQRAVIHREKNTVVPNPQPENVRLPLQAFDIAKLGKPLYGRHQPLPLPRRKAVHKLLRGFFDDDLIAHASPHSRLQSSSETASSLSGSCS